MFEFDPKYLGMIILGIAIALRPYIFRKLNVKGFIAHLIYFFLLMLIIIPLNMYKIQFTSLNDENSKELIENVLTMPTFSNFTNKIENIEWKASSSNSDLYNVKANIYDKNKEYTLYLQPTCNNLSGCKIGVDKILIVEKGYPEYSVDTMTEDIYSKRICQDLIVQNLLKGQIKSAIDRYADNIRKIENGNFEYKIQSLSVNNFRKIKNKFSKGEIPKKYKLSNVCEADFRLNSFFKVPNTSKKDFENALHTLFNKVSMNDNNYTISSIVKYEIYTAKEEVVVNALPFNINNTLLEDNKTK